MTPFSGADVAPVDAQCGGAEPDKQKTEQDQRERPADRIDEVAIGEVANVRKQRDGADEKQYATPDDRAQIHNDNGDRQKQHFDHRPFEQ